MAARFSLASGLLVTVSLGALTILTVTASRQTLREQVLAANLTAATLVARAVEQYVADATSVMREAPGRPKLSREIHSANWPEAGKVLENFLRHFAKFDYVFIQDPQGIIRVRVPHAETVGQDFAFREFFREVMKTRRPYVSGVYSSKAAKRPVVSIAVPALDADGTVTGVLVGALSLRTMSRFVSAIGEGDGNTIYVVDGRGALVAHSGGLGADSVVDLTARSIVRAVMAGQSGTMEFQEPGNAERVLGAYVPISPLGWGVVAAKPAALAYAAADRLGRWLVGITLACLAGAMLAGWGLAHMVTGPLSRIAATAERLGEGDLGARTGLPYGTGELGQLARTFDEMAASLAHQRAEGQRAEDEIRRMNVELEQRVIERTAQLSARTVELESTGRRLEALVRAGLALTSSLALDRILQEVVESATRLVDGRSAVLRLVTDDGRLEVRAAYGMSEEYLAQSRLDLARSPVAGRVIRERRVLVVEDLELRPDLPLQAALLREGVRAMATVPLGRPNRLFGVLTVHKAVPYRFSDEELSALTLSAEQTAVAIDHARLFRESEERGMRLAEQARELEAFTYTVSHDLKTPLRGMGGYARALLEDYADRLDETGRRYLGMIGASTRRMGELIDDLLRYSRLERREMRRDLRP